MPLDLNGWLLDSSGCAYVLTHLMETETEMVAALTPYIGHSMYAFYGWKRAYVRLDAITGNSVTLHMYRSGNTVQCSVFEAFGTHCARVEPKN